jgi:hypothetical protein
MQAPKQTSTMPEQRCSYLGEVFPDFTAELRPFKGHPYAGRSQDGYGRKIPTDYAIRLGARWHRVYVCCFSNAGTAYIITKDHPFLVVLDGDLISVRG